MIFTWANILLTFVEGKKISLAQVTEVVVEGQEAL